MSDPKRLLAASEDEVERALLRAGRVMAPPGSKERALMMASGALGASTAIAGGAAAGKGTALGIAKIGSIASLKWVGIVSLAGIGMTAGAVVLHEVRETRPAMQGDMTATSRAKLRPTTGGRARARPTAGTDDRWTPAPVDPLTLAPASTDVVLAPPAPPALPAAPTVMVDAGEAAVSTVPGELAMLQLARDALLAGDPGRCLSTLDRYAEQFPRGSMAPEATMLRIEALMKAGDASAARRVADAYLASDPESPYGARVRSLLQVSDP